MRNLYLILILLMVLIMASFGIMADLPYSPRLSTETQQIIIAVKFGSGDLNPHHFGHPVFFADLLFFLYGIIFLFGKCFNIFGSPSDYARLFFTDPTLFYLTARIIVLIFAILSIWMLYLIGKRLFDKRVSLVACLFMAFSPVFVKLAHYGSPDIPMLFFSLSSFYFIMRISQKGLLRDYLLAGFLAGLAIGAKYNAGLLIIPILFAHYFSPQRNNGLSWLFDKKLAILLFCILLAFFLSNPFTFLDYKTFLTGTGVAGSGFIKDTFEKVVLVRNYNFPSWKKIDKLGWLYIFTDTLPFAIGMPLTILVIFGILYAFYRHNKKDYLLLSLILVSFIVIGSWKAIQPRYFINIFPLMFLLAARVLVEILSKVKFSERFKRSALEVASLLLIILPLSEIIKFDLFVSQKPVYAEAKEWIESNIPSESSIATLTGIPLVPNEESIKRQLQEIRNKKIGLGLRLENLLSHLSSFKVTYDIIELPYPWREDYDDADFNFHSQIEKGVKFFIFTQEMEEYLADPKRYNVQVNYFNLVKRNCTLIKEFRAPYMKMEPGFFSNDKYVKVYRFSRFNLNKQ